MKSQTKVVVKAPYFNGEGGIVVTAVLDTDKLLMPYERKTLKEVLADRLMEAIRELPYGHGASLSTMKVTVSRG
jgi:hypothetical protein